MRRTLRLLSLSLVLVACESDHDRASAARERGRLELEAGRPADAIERLREADVIEPLDDEGLRLLSRAQLGDGRWADTVATLDRLREPNADDLERRARAELGAEHWAAALDAIDATLALDARRDELLSSRGRALEALERLDEAAETYVDAARADLALAEPRVALARIWLDGFDPILSPEGCDEPEATASAPAEGELEPCLEPGAVCPVRVRAREVLRRAAMLLPEDAPELATVGTLLARLDTLDEDHAATCDPAPSLPDLVLLDALGDLGGGPSPFAGSGRGFDLEEGLPTLGAPTLIPPGPSGGEAGSVGTLGELRAPLAGGSVSDRATATGSTVPPP